MQGHESARMMQDTTEITQISTGIVKLRAANPGPMTGSGTNSYLVFGKQSAVLIDPGPNLVSHRTAIMQALGGTPLQAILITHAHLDHSALTPALVVISGAQVMAFGGATSGRSAQMQTLADQGIAGGEGADLTFAPDVLLIDGQSIDIAGRIIDVIHTPGHMGGHLCFGINDLLFSGDHVMGWSTSLISPPDGDMAAYMASLGKLSLRDWTEFMPGHGDAVTDPAARLAYLIMHRQAREVSIVDALRAAPANPTDLAALIYTDTPAGLLPAAARNIFAHLIDLHDRNLVTTDGPLTANTTFWTI